MSKWQNIRLGDIADFSNGINFDKSSYCENGTYLIGVSDFGEELFPDYSTLRHIDSTIVRECNLLKDGDIVFVRSNGNKALVGRSMLIKNPPENTSFSGFCIRARIKDHESFDPLFFAYLFKSEIFRKAIAGCSIGANIQNLSQGKLASYMAYVPSIEIQRKIADVLSAYDDLIENNRKQIKLLEEAAQRLYKEWFIDLRFPGHETTPIIDGIPEGWKLTNLGTLGAFVRGKTITKDQTCSGNIPVVAGGLTPAYYHNAHNTDVPVITVSGSGANAGFSNMYFQKIWASDCSYLEKSKTQGFFFVYCFLKSNQEMLDNLQKGSAQPHVYAKDINAIAFYKPQDDVLQNFEYKTSPLFEQIANLQTSIKKATETRDRLLPKLMHGELEVK